MCGMQSENKGTEIKLERSETGRALERSETGMFSGGAYDIR